MQKRLLFTMTICSLIFLVGCDSTPNNDGSVEQTVGGDEKVIVSKALDGATPMMAEVEKDKQYVKDQVVSYKDEKMQTERDMQQAERERNNEKLSLLQEDENSHN